jgi:hypothetical protein
MTTVRPYLPLVVAALAGLAGCGDREQARVVETPPPSNEKAMPQHEPPPVALAVEDPDAAGALAVPVTLTLDDHPQGYWSVTSDQIANTGVSDAQPKERPAAAPAPVKGGAQPAKTWPTVDAGDLVLPSTIEPGRIEDVADGRELWLMVLPLNFKARGGFDKPLTRIDLAMDFAEAKGWSILPIKDVGYEGLRYGPNPMPDGPFQYWFRSDQLIPALMREEDRERGAWRLRHADGSQLPAMSTWYGVIAAPKGEHRAAVTVQARLWFTAGYEANVLLPPTRVALDFHPRAKPARVEHAPAKTAEAQPSAAPAPTKTRAQ